MRLRPFAAAFAMLAAAPAAAADTMSADEVRAALAGNSTKGVIVIESPLLGHEYERFFAADGKLVSRNATRGDTDEGTWRISRSGAVCMKHSSGREYCTLMARAGDGFARIYKGQPSEEFSVLSGDAFGLGR